MSEEVRDETRAQGAPGPSGVSVDFAGEPWKSKVCLHLLRAGTPSLISTMVRLIPLPKSTSRGLRDPYPTQCGALTPQASHQACVIPVYALRLLHHAGETAGTRRRSGEALQCFCPLSGRLHSATQCHQPAVPGTVPLSLVPRPPP